MEFQVLEYVPDAIVVSDAAGQIVYVNDAAEKLFGYAKTELLGRTVDALVPARFRVRHAIHRQAYFEAPRTRPMGVGLELTGLRKDGSEIPVEINLAPVLLETGSYSIAAVRDVTEHRALEEQKRLLAKAEEEIRERDEVLAIASHELRAPVGSMQLQVNTLQRAATETANELNLMSERMATAATDIRTLSARIGRVEQNARRLARLVEELLVASNVRFGELPLKLEEADLAELTRETVTMLREEVERSGSQLTLEVESSATGTWDPIRIEQIIGNLLLNAAKFGEGKPIAVRVAADEAVARVIVEDHGPGIRPEDQERIFQRFQRAVAPGTVLGLGLGLYIARQVVRAHGGAIRLESAPGAGSTFTVELPRALALAPAPAPAHP